MRVLFAHENSLIFTPREKTNSFEQLVRASVQRGFEMAAARRATVMHIFLKKKLIRVMSFH